ncbi:hypothetical protein ABK040_006627 [Willaertia magna]
MSELNESLLQQLHNDELLAILSFLNFDRKTLCNFNYISKTFCLSMLSNHDNLWENYYKETINYLFNDNFIKENENLNEEKNKLLQRNCDFKIGIIDFYKSIFNKSKEIQKENIFKLEHCKTNYKLITISDILQKKKEILKTLKQNNNIQALKIVAIGDNYVGKTSFFYVFTETRENISEMEYMPKDFGSYSCNLPLDVDNENDCSHFVNLGVWDTPGGEEYDRIRVISYTGASIFIICFSVVDHKSFERVSTKWIKEAAPFKVPIILCGCKVDLRNDKKEVFKLLQKNLAPITKEEGECKAKEIEAVGYIETSSWTGEGFNRQLLQYVMLWGVIGVVSEVNKCKKADFPVLKNISFFFIITVFIMKKYSSAYYNHAQMFLFFFDICDRNSLDFLEHEFKILSTFNTFGLLIGAKCDKENEREVSVKEAENIAKRIGIPYIECSSKTNYNVETILIYSLLVKYFFSSPKEIKIL